MGLAELQARVKELESLKRRADKCRGKSGYLEISRETLANLEGAAGGPVDASPVGNAVRVAMEDFVAAVDLAVDRA